LWDLDQEAEIREYGRLRCRVAFYNKKRLGFVVACCNFRVRTVLHFANDNIRGFGFGFGDLGFGMWKIMWKVLKIVGILC
jgi:hypothetical protein